MEVKIKQGEEMIDATIEMVDGVMVVSPKEVKFEPKDGDIITSTNKACSYVSIFKAMTNDNLSFYHYAMIVIPECDKVVVNDWCDFSNPRPATEEEKELLLDKLAEEGLEWKADTKELVKLKWKPKEGEQYWYPFMCIRTKYSPLTAHWNIGRDRDLLDKGWVFKTEYECQEFCKRLNEAINQVKP